MRSLIHDLRYGVRLLVLNPGFSAVAVLVLALGIGANTAVFSIVNAMILQPIPSDGPDIVGIYSKDTTRPDEYRSFSYAEYRDIKASRDVFADVMGFTMTMAGTTEGDSTRRIFAAVVGSTYFSTLRTTLAARRTFTEEEERPDSDVPVVVAGYQFARKAGLAPADVLGRTVRINAREYTVIGVAPEGFGGTMTIVAPEFWLPLGVYRRLSDDTFQEKSQLSLSDSTNRQLMMVGRLRPGLTATSAAPFLAAITDRLRRADPAGSGHQSLMVQRLPRLAVSTNPATNTGPAALSALLMGMSALVLLISSLNLANMLLARGTARRKEIALRLAIGAARGRIVRQLLTESLLVAGIGGAAGLLLAMWGTRLLTSTLVGVLPLVLTFDGMPDVRVLAATMGFSVLSTIAAGLGPAWRATRPDVLPDLKQMVNDVAGRRWLSMRNGLVVGQLALSLALLTAAGLFMRGAIKAGVADPGFPLDGGVIANVSPSLAGYDEARGTAAIRSIIQRIRNSPGVRSASLASIIPFGEIRIGERVQRAGAPPAAEGQPPAGVNATFTVVGADYFETLRMPVVRGREFSRAEEESSVGTRVVVLDEALAREVFGGQDPIGQRVQLRKRDEARPEPLEVVGIVAGVRDDMFDKKPEPHVYVPFGQAYRGGMNIHVRLDGGGRAAEVAMLGTLRQVIREVDPAVPLLTLKTLEQHRDNSIMLWVVNTGARLFSIFGGVALLLAVVGIYGVKSYLVSRRTREIGIRMALGATRSNVLWLILQEGLVLTAAGITVGLVLSWGIGRLLSSLLYEVSPLDPVVFAVAPLLLSAAAMAAAFVPARRAATVAPLSALRSE